MIGIICFWDRIATPYLEKYENFLIENNIEYRVILWNRDPNKTMNLKKNDIVINLNNSKSFIKKLILFFVWKKKITKVLTHHKFDKLIVLSTMPGFLLNRLIIKKFRNKYLFDIRDYTFEKNYLFRSVIGKLIDNSFFTTISSKGFLTWLPESSKIVVNHNITVNNVSEVTEPNFNGSKIEFAFVGNVRLDKQTKSVLVNLNQSKKYISSFYGRVIPTSDTAKFIKDKNIKNVSLHGEFTNDQKGKIYSSVGLINAVYANSNNPKNYGDSTPLPNRVYDCAIFKRPIVCSKNTYLEKIVNEYNLGFAINGFDDDVESQFDNYINTFDKELFVKGCNSFLLMALEEEQVFTNKLEIFLKG